MRAFSLFAALGAACLFHACAPGPEMPKGNIGQYQSAKLIGRNAYAEKFGSRENLALKKKVHGMIQRSLKAEFGRQGVNYGRSDADLEVAYLILVQNKAITYHYNDYFGHGPNANEIARNAHERGVVDKEVSNYHHKAGILIDVIDSRSKEIIYRHFYATDVIHIPNDSVRAARIDYAVRSALAPFFVKTP